MQILLERPEMFVGLSERSLLIRLEQRISESVHRRAVRLATMLERNPFPGMGEIVTAYASVTVYYEPLPLLREAGGPGKYIASWLQRALGDETDGIEEPHMREPVEIPVCYGGAFGDDLAELAAHCGLSEAKAVQLHAAQTYTVYMLGFAPGFAYLGGLPERLGMPRKATPRLAVPSGTVAIGGMQTGIYPMASPGGWQLIGRTPLEMFRPWQYPPSLLQAGDHVRFVPISPKQYDHLAAKQSLEKAEVTASAAANMRHEAEPSSFSFRKVMVMRAGMLTTVQDLGRCGHQRYGVHVSGAMDPLSLRIANMLAGNGENAPCLEMTVSGAELTFAADALIAICGGDLQPQVNGVAVPMWRPVAVQAGSTLSFGAAVAGVRAYVAVAGGWAAEPVLGSSSTDLLAGLGGHARGRALAAGDTLEYREPSSQASAALAALLRLAEGAPFAAPSWFVSPDVYPDYDAAECAVRMVRGPDADRLTAADWERLRLAGYTLSPQSNRKACRFVGAPLQLDDGSELLSSAVATGTVQLPPDGLPIVLMADSQTVGGYPVIGQLAAVDLPVLSQARAGTNIYFHEISLAEAHRLWSMQEAELAQLRYAVRRQLDRWIEEGS